MALSVEEIDNFVKLVMSELMTGQTTEHSFRPVFKKLFSAIDRIKSVNEPKHSKYGAPDFIFLGGKNKDLILGYAEMKDIDKNLDEIEKSEQMERYRGYKNIFLTNNLDFRFFRNGVKYFEIKIGQFDKKSNQIVELYRKNYQQLANELVAFFDQTPESITSGKRLAEIMGGKARRIRDNIKVIFESHSDAEIENIYDMMKELLVTDLTVEQFADMYAQTLVYGLFVARYNDSTPNDFTRAEARDLVPATNPFLREFFDHIAGVSFNKSLGYIVDELCEIFAVSDIKTIVHKHLKLGQAGDDTRDPIIHFYEDFLANYDAELRKKMGAYYTPTPVVRYIVRMVDKVLKEDFGFADGIASNDKIKYTHRVDPYQSGKTIRSKLLYEKTESIPAVQILDPAVGTATFLNEVIKYIYNQKFDNQRGLWNSYVNDNILPRLNGFELMMTPYTIAHLKLGMTLSELGAKELKSRLRVFLTNTLTEGIENDSPLFRYGGLVATVAEESNLAAEVKNDLPVMVVMGNPPYSVSSSNKSKFIEKLVADYKKDLNERNIQPLSDDYIKFIRFAEYMVEKNSKGIVAMITNNSYIDGIIHRKMREHLLRTFDKIYILDLHGNTRKKEISPDGSPDQNVFDIIQGVSIIIAVRNRKHEGVLGKVYHAELYGNRKSKFDALNGDKLKFKSVKYGAPNYFLVPKDDNALNDYNNGVQVPQLFMANTVGVVSGKDSVLVGVSKQDVDKKIAEFKISGNGEIHSALIKNEYNENCYKTIAFRPFDNQTIYYDTNILNRSRFKIMKNVNDEAPVFVVERSIGGRRDESYHGVFITNHLVDKHLCGGASYAFPLYFFHPDGTKTPNFNPDELKKLTVNIGKQTPEDIFDYIYAVLHSPSYREKYKEFLKIDFPRVPIPTEKEFKRLAPLGYELRELHLMHKVPKTKVTFPIEGDNIVDKLRFEDNKVYINKTQYFDNVSELAWNFYIGGYQPAQKWLKDRKDRELNTDNILHYERIIAIMEETYRIMNEIG